MSLLRFEDLVAKHPSLELDATRFMGSRAFHQIMSDTDVPQDPDAGKNPDYQRQIFERSDANDLAIAKFAYLASRNPLVLLTDLDGTGSRFTESVETSRLAPGYMDALMRLSSAHLFSKHPEDFNAVYAITGRSEQDALTLLSVNQRLAIPLIHSHGTGMVSPNGTREDIALSMRERGFLEFAFACASNLKTAHPDLLVQIKQSGIDVKDPDGTMIEAIRETFKDLVQDSPKQNGRRVFGVHDEGPVETSIRYDMADKANAITQFVLDKLEGHSGALLVYAGDSFGKGGTDRRAGEFVQSLGGIVIRVLNDRAGSDDGFKPDIILPNPEAMSALISSIATTKEALARTSHPQQSSEPTPQRV